MAKHQISFIMLTTKYLNEPCREDSHDGAQMLYRVSAQTISGTGGQSISYAEADSYLDFLLSVLPKTCIRVQIRIREAQ